MPDDQLSSTATNIILQSIQRDIAEMKDRARRIETRVTTYLTSIGHEVIVSKPVWSNKVANTVVIPSLNTPIRDVLELIANQRRDWVGYYNTEYRVVHKDVPVLTLNVT